jgi:hypothetical protein
MTCAGRIVRALRFGPLRQATVVFIVSAEGWTTHTVVQTVYVLQRQGVLRRLRPWSRLALVEEGDDAK